MKRLLVVVLFGMVGLVPTANAAIEISDMFSVNGEVRLRNDYFRNYDFDADTGGDDNVATLRSTIGFSVKPVDNVVGHIELRDWRILGENGIGSYGDPETNGSDIDLYQGYFQIILGDNWLFKGGRTEVDLGWGTMFSNYDTYQGLSHDAFIIAYLGEDWDATLFSAKWNEASSPSNNFAGADQNDNTGYGLHIQARFSEKRVLDAQLAGGKLNSWSPQTYPGAQSTTLNDLTILHLSGAWKDDEFDTFFYGAQGIIQMGTAKDDTPGVQDPEEFDIFAGAFLFHAGVKFEGGQHRLWLEGSLASGNDDDAEELEEFVQLFGDNDGRLGLMDNFVLSNIIHLGARYRGMFMDDALTLEFGFHYFSVYEETGGIYTTDIYTGRAILLGGGTADNTALGFEVDALADYKFNEYFSLTGQLGFFAPQDYYNKANGEDGDPAILVSLGAKVKV